MPSIKEGHLASLLETREATGRLALWAGLLGATLVLYGLGLTVYRIWFHPLSKFPGPVSMVLTEWTYLYKQHILGSFIPQSGELHRKYGKIVRIGPNRILVDGSVGWNDVFAHRPGGDATEFHKPQNWFFPGDHASLLNAPTRDDHRRQRRQLSHAFSEAAMTEQAPVIMFYIDLLIQRLAENASGGRAIDMVKWLNFLTFDIIGDLSLGESFHSLETSDYHPWVLNIFLGIRGMNKTRFFRSIWPALATVYSRFETSGTLKANVDNMMYARAKARARVALGPEPPIADREQVVGLDGKKKMTVRRDFMTYMMRNGTAGSDGKTTITEDELLNNAFILITAGSETTATNLSTLFYMLALPSNRAYRDAVAAEVRTAFSRDSEMNLLNVSAKALPLLHACIEESLRYHTPASTITPRISRGAPVGGHYIPEGVNIHLSAHATYLNSEHFFDAGSWRPERWLPAGHAMHDARFANDDTSVFKPFSYGPRDCIGKNLSYAEMRLVAARILLRFDVEVHPDTPDDWLSGQRSFGLWEKGPMMLRLNERKDLVSV